MSAGSPFDDYLKTIDGMTVQVTGVRRRPDGDGEVHVLTVRVRPSDEQPAPAAAEPPPLMLLDWDRLAEAIRHRKSKRVEVNLRGRLSALAVTVYFGGRIVPEEHADYSIGCRYRTPVAIIDGAEEPCFVFADERPDWSPTTYWPASARQLLAGADSCTSGTLT